MTSRRSTEGRWSRFSVIRNRPLLTLMSGHFTVDMYVGVLPVLYPLLTETFDLSLKTVGLISFAYSGMASISQPLFGWIADRRGTRLAGLALLWTAATFALLGLAPNFPVLVALAGLAGIGSGAYHPMGAVNASAVIPEGQRNSAMSIYVTGGTLGVAIGPLVGALVIALLGLRGTLLLVIPGAIIASMLLVEMRTIAQRLERRRTGPGQLPPIPLWPLSTIIGLMMLRAWVLFGIGAFVPLWYASLGYSRGFYAALSSTLLIFSAIGAVAVGTLADRHGRKALLLWSSVLSVPAILLFAQFTGRIGFLTAALIGLLAASTGPLLLVMAQQVMVGRQGVASGLILGLGFVMGAIGVPVMGAFADVYGIQQAMRAMAVIAAGAIVLTILLPSDAAVERLAARGRTARDSRSEPAMPVTAEGDRRHARA